MKNVSNATMLKVKVVTATMDYEDRRLPATHPLYDAWMFTSRWQADVSTWDEEMVEFARKCVAQQKQTFYNTWTDED